MSSRPTRPYDQARFALADRIAMRVLGRRTADEATREAVAILTASASPDRAEKLRPRPTEPAALVERLAMWALHRATDDAVAAADARLDAELSAGMEAEAGTAGAALG